MKKDIEYKKHYEPRFLLGGEKFCNSDMACKIFVEIAFPDISDTSRIQAKRYTLERACREGKVSAFKERSIKIWDVDSVNSFAKKYKDRRIKEKFECCSYDMIRKIVSEELEVAVKTISTITKASNDEIVEKIKSIFNN